ncbi:MAG TPA: mycothiol synthase [Trebonia sp.]|nr:mycothiol synthase [Trebonia sp.]
MTRIIEGPLSPAQARLVLELAAAARASDGVAPLSEHVMLHVQHGEDSPETAGREALILAEDPAASENAASENTVVGYAYLDPADDGAQSGDMSGELVIHPAHRRQGHGTALVTALLAGADGHGVRVWSHGDLPGAAAFARSTGFTRFRELWQMRRPLGGGAPLPEAVVPAGVTLRTFRPGADDEAWLALNRTAFASHPEQGSWTREDLELRKAEPWFDPAGFFIAEKDGALAGFHWTKMHPDGGSTGGPVGEVYVVGVAPGQQGGGLGNALTLAGLAHLRDRGLDEVMLYVDGDNTAAIRLYTRLGFGQWHTDVMYRHA